MKTTRAKFYCGSADRDGGTGCVYRFTAAYQADVPEGQRYAKYTPIGEVKMVVDNPAVEFKVGAHYYVDFTPVDGEG